MRRFGFALPLIATLGGGFAPFAAQAALSGFYDSGAQIAQILASEELGNRLRQLPVAAMEFRGADAGGLLDWRVSSQDCTLQVLLRAEPPKGVGATSYAVESIGECGQAE